MVIFKGIEIFKELLTNGNLLFYNFIYETNLQFRFYSGDSQLFCSIQKFKENSNLQSILQNFRQFFFKWVANNIGVCLNKML